jgi:DNA-binding XRE family transcriptional regulator
MAKKKEDKLETYSLDEVTDEAIGKRGTPEREEFEYELKMDILGDMIRDSRKERGLTQKELGKLIGVNKTQISKLENNARNATIENILKVFNALNAELKLKVKLKEHQELDLTE